MQIITKNLTTKGLPLKIHAIPVGRLAIKQAAMETDSPGTWRTLQSFWTKEFADWLPIWAWVIEHPEGIFLIDTGETTDVNDINHFKPIGFLMNYYFTKQMKFDIKKTDEIDQQLLKIGLQTSSIDKILLTHLHIDHIDGLKHFSNTPVVVNDLEWTTKDGSFPVLYPNILNQATKIALTEKFEEFEAAHYITKTKDLIMVQTPGHTSGHCSFILKTDQGMVFFAGDVVYTQGQLFGKVFSATVASYKKSLNTCHKIKAFARKHKIVFLPTHDIKSGLRLQKMEMLQVSG